MEMKKQYSKIKQAAKKYALPALVAGNMALGGCGKDKIDNYLPILEKQKIEQIAYLDSLSNKADKTLKLAEESFQEGISDKNYTSKEMGETLSLYGDANNLYKKVKFLGKNVDEKYNISLPENSRQVKKDIHKVFYGVNIGKSKLEKELNKSSLDVKVKGDVSFSEVALMFLSALGIGLPIMIKLSD